MVLRSDVERKALFGVDETERAAARRPIRREVTARVYAALAAKARRVITAGHSAIVDAVLRRPGRARRRSRRRAASAAFHGLFLTADLATRVARVGGRSRDASDADAAVARAPGTLRSRRAWTGRSLDASGTPDETLRRARAALS